MGADFADYDNDGWPDVFVNALANQKYALFHNDKGKFEDIIDAIGLGAITMSHSGWGAKWIDYDNDGRLDLFVAQGHVMDNIELTEPSSPLSGTAPFAAETPGLDSAMFRHRAVRHFKFPLPPAAPRLEISTTTALSISPSTAMMARQLFSAIREAMGITGCWSTWLARSATGMESAPSFGW